MTGGDSGLAAPAPADSATVARRIAAANERAALLLNDDPASAEGLRILLDVALHRRCHTFALSILDRLDAAAPGVDTRLVRSETLLRLGRVAEADSLLAEAADGADAWRLRALAALARRDPAAASAAFDAASRLSAAGEDHRSTHALRWAAAWAGSVRATAEGSRDPLFAVPDYGSPDFRRAGQRTDDYLFSYAALRIAGLSASLRAAADAASLGEALQLVDDAGRDSKRARGRFAVTTVDRDSLWSCDVRHPGRDVWTVLGGRCFEPAFDMVSPYAGVRGLQPLIVGLAFANATVASPELLAWLRPFAPVGCADRPTAERLASQGVPAFVSGRLSSTLGVLKVARAPGDAPPRAPARDVEFRTMGLGLALKRVAALLAAAVGAGRATAGGDFADACSALGVTVTPPPPDAPAPSARDARARNVVRALSEALSLAAAGAPVADVREAWRARTQALADQVAETLRRKTAIERPPVPPLAAPAPAGNRPLTVTLTFDRNYLKYALPVLRSLRAHTRADLRLALVTRGLTRAQLAPAFAAAGPCEALMVEADHLPSRVDRRLSATMVASMFDRLQLPHLLPDVDRVVYLDVDMILQGDVAELAEVPLGASGVAARPTPNVATATIAQAIETRASQAPPGVGERLRDRACSIADVAKPYFNAGVLVLSLDRLRRSRFVERASGLMASFGFHDQDAINLTVGGDYERLPWHWNAQPQFEFVEEAKAIHWAGSSKPWSARPVLAAGRWSRFAQPSDSL